MRIATSRYSAVAEIEESGLLPIGVTVGPPRWLRYELAGNVGMLAPFGDVDGVPLRKVDDVDVFAAAYRQRLERFGVGAIRRLLEAFAAGHGAEGVALLCYEDVVGKGLPCHRRVFADWWQERTGEEVVELEA